MFWPAIFYSVFYSSLINLLFFSFLPFSFISFLFCSILLFYSVLFDCILFQSIQFCLQFFCLLFWSSLLLHSFCFAVPFHPILCYFILSFSYRTILLHLLFWSILFYVFYSLPFCCSILFHLNPVPLFSYSPILLFGFPIFDCCSVSF